MPVVVELLDEQEHRVQLPDPSGGYFDAAGDFERLVGHASEALTTWALFQEYENVVLAPEQMPSLLEDLDELLRVAKPGPEERGLRRLIAMAEACRDSTALSLRSIGDCRRSGCGVMHFITRLAKTMPPPLRSSTT